MHLTICYTKNTLTFLTIPRGLGSTIYFNYNSTSTTTGSVKDGGNIMLGGFGSSTSAGLASGGTVDGDLVVTGDFKVEGAGSFAYDEIIQGTIGATRVNIGTRNASVNPPTDNASYSE